MGELVASNRGGSFFTSYIKQRIERNKNFVCCITGQTGSGKSYSALTLCEQLDPEFSKENICFTPKDFMDLVTGKRKGLKKGSCILFDELQVSMSHLSYQSMQSRMLNYVLQTFRHRNFILIITTPHFNFVDKSARQLFHSRMETISIDKGKKQVVLKPLLLQTNQSTGKVYAKFLRIATGEGVVPLNRLRVSMPSRELIQQYEEAKTEFTTNLNKKISEELDRLENPNKKKQKLTKKQEQVIELILQRKKVPEIAEELGIEVRSVYDRMELIQNKGIDFKAVKDGCDVLYYEVEGYEE